MDVAAGSALSAGKEAASRVATGPTRESGCAASRASRALVTEEGSGARSPVLGSPLSGGIWADRPNRSGRLEDTNLDSIGINGPAPAGIVIAQRHRLRLFGRPAAARSQLQVPREDPARLPPREEGAPRLREATSAASVGLGAQRACTAREDQAVLR